MENRPPPANGGERSIQGPDCGGKVPARPLSSAVPRAGRASSRRSSLLVRLVLVLAAVMPSRSGAPCRKTQAPALAGPRGLARLLFTALSIRLNGLGFPVGNRTKSEKNQGRPVPGGRELLEDGAALNRQPQLPRHAYCPTEIHKKKLTLPAACGTIR
jgi:hypothetical protein